MPTLDYEAPRSPEPDTRWPAAAWIALFVAVWPIVEAMFFFRDFPSDEEMRRGKVLCLGAFIASYVLTRFRSRDVRMVGYPLLLLHGVMTGTIATKVALHLWTNF